MIPITTPTPPNNTHADSGSILSDWSHDYVPLCLGELYGLQVTSWPFKSCGRGTRETCSIQPDCLVSTLCQFGKHSLLTSELTLPLFSNKKTKGLKKFLKRAFGTIFSECWKKLLSLSSGSNCVICFDIDYSNVLCAFCTILFSLANVYQRIILFIIFKLLVQRPW